MTDSPKKMAVCCVVGVAISVGLGARIADAQCPFVTAAAGKSSAAAIFTGVATKITTERFANRDIRGRACVAGSC